MLTKDPYGFQTHTICDCSYLCYIQQVTHDNKYFPKNYDEYMYIRKQIIMDNSFLKKNLPIFS